MAKNYFERLMGDVRMREGVTSCMGCGVCTAVCPAAEFYDYDPRRVVSIVMSRDDDQIEALLRSEALWMCGECMSCRPRCPRGNTPGYVIQALRKISQEDGFFVESEKGRQQLALKRVIGGSILETGYCIYPRLVSPDLHPEQGPVWRWIWENHDQIYPQFSPNYGKAGTGAFRKIGEASMDELRRIFEVSGGMEFLENIERHSEAQARKMGYPAADDKYVQDIYTKNTV